MRGTDCCIRARFVAGLGGCGVVRGSGIPRSPCLKGEKGARGEWRQSQSLSLNKVGPSVGHSNTRSVGLIIAGVEDAHGSKQTVHSNGFEPQPSKYAHLRNTRTTHSQKGFIEPIVFGLE